MFERINVITHLPNLCNPHYKKQFLTKNMTNDETVENNNEANNLDEKIPEKSVENPSQGINNFQKKYIFLL